MQTYRAREAAARERRARAAEERTAERLRQDPAEALAAAQRVADENARRRREARGLAESSGSGGQTALQRLLDADGMNMCSLNFQARQRILYGAGSLSRWGTWFGTRPRRPMHGRTCSRSAVG